MNYCVEHAIPHSIFLGRVPAVDEPHWLVEDRAKTMATLLERSEVCTRCGTADWEWLADMDAYEPVLHRCHGCLVLTRAEEANRGTDGAPAGETMRLAPKAVATRMRHAPKARPQRRRRRD